MSLLHGLRTQSDLRDQDRKRIIFALVSALFLFSRHSFAEWNFAPFMAVEGAAFENDKSSLTQDRILSFIPGVAVENIGEKFSYVGKAAYRFDTFDRKRDFLYIRENVVRWQSEEQTHSVGFGHQRLQLGALDIFQSIDSINDLVTDSFSTEIQRRGLPILDYRYTGDNYKAAFYYLPVFEATYYPPNSSRFGYGFQFDEQKAVSSSGKVQNQGFRTDQFGGKFDLNTEKVDYTFGYFHMIDRGISIAALNQDARFNRYFFESDMVFATAQGVFGEHILKANLYAKDYHGAKVPTINLLQPGTTLRGPKQHSMASLGWETKVPLIKNHDTTLLVEAQRLLGIDRLVARRYSLFSNDAAWGIRHLFNDLKGQQISLLHIIDLNNSQQQIFIGDYKYSFSDALKLNTGVRIIKAARSKKDATFNLDNLAGLTLIDDADCLYATMTYYF